MAPSKAPENLSLGMPSTVENRKTSREPSGSVYDTFDHKQVQQFKEAFSMIDQNGDGLITEQDLREMYSSLGQTLSDATLKQLLERSTSNPPGINFTLFLTLMSEKLLKLDPSDELMEAFACFDENDSGTIKADDLHYWLGQVGDKMTDEEIDKLVRGPPYGDRKGNFNYREFVNALRANGPEQE